jgi:hypothetical protein
MIYFKDIDEGKFVPLLFLTEYHAMNRIGGVEVKLHAFLTSASDGSEWLA